MAAQRTVRETWRRHIVGLLEQALERNDAAISEVAAAISTTSDLCWVISNSGRNALVVEIALEARRHGVTVVGLVSAEHSATVSAAPGLPKLPEIADHLLDNGGCFGDAALDIPGVAERMAPTSTIVGAALIHAIWAEAGERLAARGHVPEVWGSANRGPV